ncbi:MAG: glycosyltransferase family 39 protein [Solirubrobacteraceae bacterium]
MTISLRADDATPSVARASARTRTIAPDLWLLAAITAIAALLRFSTITSQSFWFDEAVTVHEVSLSFGSMLHAIHVEESTPPLYFSLAWLWTRLFGSGELGIRSLSALAGTALVPVAYMCGRELVSRSAGVLTAAFVAVSPFMIWYSQEARAYMLFALFGGLSLMFFARALRTRGTVDLGLWVVCAALAMLTHFFAAFLVAPEAVWLLWRLRNRACAIACGAAAVVQLALAPLALVDRSHHLLGWIVGLQRSLRIEQISVQFAVSELYRSSSPLAGHGELAALILAAIVVALLWLGAPAPQRRGALLAGGLGLFVVLVPIALSEIGLDFVLARNMMIAWLPLAIVLAAACTAPRARLAGGALAIVLVAGFVWAGVVIDGSSYYRRTDWRGAAAALGPATGARAIVAYDGNQAEAPLAIYLPRTQFSYSGWPASLKPQILTELDVVAYSRHTIATRLPAGVRLIPSEAVNGIFVARFALSPAERLSPAAIAARASAFVGPASAGRPAILVQNNGTSEHRPR